MITTSQKLLKWRWGGEMDDDRVEDEAFSDEPLSDDTEYVDDPQIDLLSA